MIMITAYVLTVIKIYIRLVTVENCFTVISWELKQFLVNLSNSRLEKTTRPVGVFALFHV